MNTKLALAALALTVIACKEDTSNAPPSTLIVDDSTGRIVGSAVPAPDGTRLAFTKVIDGRSSVYTSDLDGKNAVRISHGVWDTGPVWSPDGKWIAYSGEDPDFDVYVVSSDGSAQARQITSGSANDGAVGWTNDGVSVLINRAFAGDDHPVLVSRDGGPAKRTGPVVEGNLHAALSPDGAMLGFDVHRGEASTMWVQDTAQGAAPRQLTTEGLENGAAQTMWSPDSKQIAYMSRRTGTEDIWILDVATGQKRQLTNDVRNDDAPRWSPDGKWIAFLSERGGQTDLWMVPSAGGSATRLTNDAARENAPRWARDGKSVYYSRTTNAIDLQFVPLAGGAPRTIRSWAEFDMATPRLSPDGKTLLYASNWSGNNDMFMLSAAGGEPVVFASSPRNDGAPKYSPDGTQIAFSSDRGGTFDIWIVPAAGGEPRNLTAAPGNESDFEWSPDGTRMVFASNRDVGGADLWVIPVAGGQATRLTRDNLRPGRMEWSPDGRFVYFVGFKPGARGIRDYFRVAATGGPLEALGATPFVGDAARSKDGSRVAYTSFERGWSIITLMSPRGGPSRRISPDTANVYELAWRWTPSDSVLILAALDLTANRDAADLFAYRASDGSRTQLTNTPWGFEEPIGFTPDGKEIAVIVRTDRAQIRRVSVAGIVATK
ncbi:MAG TPA: DPP IV N-terminal domain-containing protein [Gemmatimonadaceae bacterium]|nr:DPP IV N-terminal domain-containing protein [Gemmatimonadaceae bacterium]